MHIHIISSPKIPSGPSSTPLGPPWLPQGPFSFPFDAFMSPSTPSDRLWPPKVALRSTLTNSHLILSPSGTILTPLGSPSGPPWPPSGSQAPLLGPLRPPQVLPWPSQVLHESVSIKIKMQLTPCHFKTNYVVKDLNLLSLVFYGKVYSSKGSRHL